jgi:hypothetical protein
MIPLKLLKLLPFLSVFQIKGDSTVADSKPRVSNVDFVTAYKSSSSHNELAKKIGLTKASVASRAAKLRKLGVNLAKYAREKPAVDVEALNAILKNDQ